MGLLFQSADLIAILIETSLIVGIGFLAAESVLVHDTVLSMDMLLHPTGQLPVSIAKRAMGVVFVLGKRTCQSIRIHRFLHRLKAGVRMLMLQNLDFAADQITSIIKAVRCVFVKNYFRLVTDQLGFACFRYGIAAVGMLMGFNLR